MDNRRQVNISLNIAKTDDAAIQSGLEQRAAEWQCSTSEAAKRLLSAGLGTAVETTAKAAPVVVASPDNSELIKAMVAMTHELVALRKQVASMKPPAPVATGSTAPIPVREPERELTEADVELNPVFVTALKKAARPGIRLDGNEVVQ